MPTTTTTSPPFTVVASPQTDLWRKPPSTSRANAPFKALTPAFPLTSFHSAGVTFTAPYTKLYDQGGILITLTHPSWPQTKWVKSGVEFYQGKPFLGTAATYTFSDWSLAPVTTSKAASSQAVTVLFERSVDELGSSLWVYQLVLDAEGKEVERVPLRECTWVFAEEDGVQVEVAAYAARPKGEEGEEGLDVKFEKAWVEVLG